MVTLDNGTHPACPTADTLSSAVSFPSAYHCEILGPDGVATLIEEVGSCYPGLAVGGASCLLRDDFYANRVVFEHLFPAELRA